MAKEVVIVSRLLSLTRAEAERVAAQTGSELAEHVTANTSLVVLGGRGPHFQHSGRAMVQLTRARRLAQQGQPIRICTEEEWLIAVGMAAPGVRQRYTATQVAETLGISRANVERWAAAGLLEPSEDSVGIPLFDFRQVAAARTMAELSRRGVRLSKIRQAVKQLAQWLPETERSLADLTLQSDARQLTIRTAQGAWAEPSGQLLFDFEAQPDSTIITLTGSKDQEALFRSAVAVEDAEPLAAAELYRQFLATYGPHATVIFNLGNVLYAADDVAGALQQYHRVTELAPDHAGAWNNLANVLAELDQLEEALTAYRRALALSPQLADARFNLAQTLVELGRLDEAVLHWRAYLSLDDDSAWADYARDWLERH